LEGRCRGGLLNKPRAGTPAGNALEESLSKRGDRVVDQATEMLNNGFDCDRLLEVDAVVFGVFHARREPDGCLAQKDDRDTGRRTGCEQLICQQQAPFYFEVLIEDDYFNGLCLEQDPGRLDG
jgi:hypothetical protein